VCSAGCRVEHYRGANSRLFVGSYIESATGFKKLHLVRPGFASKYIREHRVVASKAIGRMLLPSEPVIHVNGNPSDCSPGNLFVCRSNGEMVKRYAGKLPWPTIGNLDTYR